jgi:hypothetical protein
LLPESVTVDPPAGAACVSVTVQVLVALWARLAGVQEISATLVTVTTPLFVCTGEMPEPVPSAPTALPRTIEVIVALGDKVT